MTEKSEKKCYVYYQMILDLDTIDQSLLPRLIKWLKGRDKVLKIREIHDESLDKVTHVVNRAFLDAPDPYERVMPDDFKELGEEYVIFIASMYGKDVGVLVILLNKMPHLGKKAATISLIAVIPERKFQGISTSMAIHAYKWLRSHDIRYVKCLVGKDNEPAYRFMTRLGFKKYGEKEFTIDE
ncbi:MAG: GNAT family N-acetyltransferase [Candidatus Helarchaeota archaeon]